MEYASFLAGERWSDHPACTHPLLAAVARDVNDHISNDGRSRLVPLIPSVVGLDSSDPRADIGIALRCGATALPVAAEPRQRALAVGVLAAGQALADLNEASATSFDTAELERASNRALTHAPHAKRWAEGFVRQAGAASSSKASARFFRRQSAPSIVRVAVTAIAEACISDRDALLYELLAAVIQDCEAWFSVDDTFRQILDVGADAEDSAVI